MTGPPLKRQIGLYAATAVTVGSIIGSGIFRSPHSVAHELHTVQLMLLAWVVGGLLSMAGSLALAEIAVAHPETGGLYCFIREGFGKRLAFVFGWASLAVIKPTVIASITSVFAIYFCQAVGWPAAAQLPDRSRRHLLAHVRELARRAGRDDHPDDPHHVEGARDLGALRRRVRAPARGTERGSGRGRRRRARIRCFSRSSRR